MLWKNSTTALNFASSSVPRTQDLPVYFKEIPDMYAFKKDVFEVYKRKNGVNPHIVEISGIECVRIDYPEDLMIADAIYKYIILNNRNTH